MALERKFERLWDRHDLNSVNAGGGTRTRTGLAPQGILSLFHFDFYSGVFEFLGVLRVLLRLRGRFSCENLNGRPFP